MSLAAASSSIARADGDTDRKAEAHKTLGKAAHDAGNYEECALQFEASNALVPEQGKLFNVGLCREKEGDLKAALAAFEAYLETWPEGERATEVRTRVELLTLKVEKQATQATTAAEPTEPTEEPKADPVAAALEPQSLTPAPEESAAPAPLSSAPQLAAKSDDSLGGKRMTAIGLGAVGVIGLGVMTVTGLGAKSDWDKSEELCPDPGPCGSLEGVQLSKDAEDSALIASISAGVSVAALAAATYLWLSDSKPERRERLTLVPTSGGASLSYGVTF